MGIFSFKMTFTDKDRGSKRIKKGWRRLDDSVITIGVHEGAGRYSLATKGSAPGVAEVAFWNEFGTKDIPQRSFLRQTMDLKRINFLNFEQKLFDQFIIGRINEKQLIKKLGFRIQSAVASRIKTASAWAERNADSVAARKNRPGGAIRGASPLMETGLLLRSITFKARLGGL